jgi:glucose-6-phosphate dehydrogenase assembly protein OpcA
VINIHKDKKRDVADLNWARMEPWRDMLSSHFRDPKQKALLPQFKVVEITYNANETTFFTHPVIQAQYLQCWLASCLQLELKKHDNKTLVSLYADETLAWQFHLKHDNRKDLPPGMILKTSFKNENEELHFKRDEKALEKVHVSASSKEKCIIPHLHQLEEHSKGRSLVKEVSYKGTSLHYLKTLNYIQQIYTP